MITVLFNITLSEMKKGGGFFVDEWNNWGWRRMKERKCEELWFLILVGEVN